MFALVDCNNFYASCERVFNPDLNGKPIVVLSNNDGCVIARSEEAKAVGIPMGAPAFKFQEVFKKHDVKIFSSNYCLYGDMSSRVMNVLSQDAPDIEVYSIDEAFLDYTGCTNEDLEMRGRRVRKQILQWIGLPVCVGIAPTKSLAKLANRIAKKYFDRTGGVYLIDSEEKRLKALKWLSIGDVWGVGRRNARKLRSYGIETAFEFTQQSDNWVRRTLSVVGLRLKLDLMGIPSINMDEAKGKQSIATTRTFEKSTRDYEYIKERITTFAVSCAEKLRKQNSVCEALMVHVRTGAHAVNKYQNVENIRLPYATNSTIDLVKFSIMAFDRIYREGYQYKKAGVIVLNISEDDHKQLSFFSSENPKHKALMKTFDQLNYRYEKNTLKLASQDVKRTWKMKQEYLSPAYTTQLKDVIKINCNE